MSCGMVKYTQRDFTGKKYEWYASSMIGKSAIQFINDSSFIYSERDSLFVCTGEWHMSNDNKTIFIKSVNNNANQLANNTPIVIITNKEFKIINRNKLMDVDKKLFSLKK